ncbi:uncharacterized protein [Dermacentor albipictus]|uniref:uncharacterized protein n=1 Tax=Dermacentor albipictus TaxID=60249 RepID=UPI0038FC60BD
MRIKKKKGHDAREREVEPSEEDRATASSAHTGWTLLLDCCGLRENLPIWTCSNYAGSPRYGSLGTSLGSVTAEIFFAEAQEVAAPPAIAAFLECAAQNAGKQLAVPMAGIHMAHRVFLEEMREASGTEKQLPPAGVEDLSPGQLFFFATVYHHCGSDELTKGNKMLRLLSGFSEAYACAKEGPMRAAVFCDQLD